MNACPTDLTAALRTAGLGAFFDDCTPAHQREYIRWITAAKRPETRRNRITQAVEMIAATRAKEAARSRKKT